MDFSAEAQRALYLLENTNKNLFITGRAGTGKSTLLRHCIANTLKDYVVLAPTGVAAVNIAGQTIHSFFGFHPGITEKEVIKAAHSRREKELYENLELLIIDEISMIRADLLDYIDLFLRTIRKNNFPFGGVQVVFFGDLYQLPPVLSNQEKEMYGMLYESPYFFSSKVIKTYANFEVIELSKIYRQTDETFIKILNSIRDGKFEQSDLDELNSRVVTDDIDFSDYIYLSTTNSTVDQINSSKLQQLESENIEFTGYISGDFDEKMLPTDFELQLKPQARVMFLNNDSDGRWINGTIGTIKKIEEDSNKIYVQIDAGQEVEVVPYTWSNYESHFDKESKSIEREEVGSFTQFPLRLAWAITIHKSQGKTFEKVFLDLGWGAFAHGQTYVALSRCTTLEGLVLKRPIRSSDIKVDSVVKDFFETIVKLENSNTERLKKAIEEKSSVRIIYLKDNKAISKEVQPLEIREEDYGEGTFKALESLDLEVRENRIVNLEKILEVQSLDSTANMA